MRRLAVRVSLAVFAAAVAGVLGIGVWGWDKFRSPGPLTSETTTIIPKGAGLETIAATLTDAGVIGHKTVFEIGVRASELAGRLRAGEYAFAPGMSMEGVARHLAFGPTVKRRLTVPEGLTTVDVIALVQSAEGLTGGLDDGWDEGALLPETYFYSYGDTRRSVIDRMSAAMADAVRKAWATRAGDLPIRTPADAVILASIIEKETGLSSERARVSGVFHNRLRRGMRLQSDPTVVYALTRGRGRLGRALTRDDLAVASPFNTYRNTGLPPAPIANPGLAAIEAAIKPLATDELYFVADGTGGHRFARTLKEHNRNVAEWRRHRRKMQQR